MAAASSLDPPGGPESDSDSGPRSRSPFDSSLSSREVALIHEASDQYLEFLAAEKIIRLRTQFLTKKEKDDLLKRGDLTQERRDVLENKPIEGSPMGVLTTWVMDMMELPIMGFAEFNVEYGEDVDALTPIFSLLKLLLSYERDIHKSGHGCHCINQSWFMPKGCECERDHPVLAGSGGMYDPCPKCSTCIRCTGLLGCSYEVQGVSMQDVNMGHRYQHSKVVNHHQCLDPRVLCTQSTGPTTVPVRRVLPIKYETPIAGTLCCEGPSCKVPPLFINHQTCKCTTTSTTITARTIPMYTLLTTTSHK